MSNASWESAPAERRRGRWPLAVGLAVVVFVTGLVARPGRQPSETLPVEGAARPDDGAPSPRSATRSPAPASPGLDASTLETPGEWVHLGDAPIDVPASHVAVWTGVELLVGFQPQVAAYDVAGGTWRRLPDVPGPERFDARAVWTGDGVVVFGGHAGGPEPHRPDGLLLDAGSQQWRRIIAPAAPLWDPTAVWTGQELIVWGGARPGDARELGDWPVRGSAVRPAESRWRVLPPAPVEAVYFSDGLWTGREVVVWGTHHPPGEPLLDEAGPSFAAAYDPASDAWRRLPAPPLANPAEAAAVWTGSRVVLWGRPPSRPVAGLPGIVGAALDLGAVENGWELLPAVGGIDDPRTSVYGVAAAWTGRAALFYGGYPRSVGLSFYPEAGVWRRLPAHRARLNAATAWTGVELLLWGGYTTTGPDVDLWAFRPPGPALPRCLDVTAAEPAQPLPRGWSWSAPPLADSAPAAAVWTGSELLTWGGSPPQGHVSADGAAVDPGMPERRCLPPAPLSARARAGHAWTDAGLFVWGGDPPRADGALYDPASRTWRLLPEAPLAARLPLAVAWTGDEVLVWGKTGGSRHRLLADGAAYDPASDTWRRLPDAPVALNQGGAAWTGEELIVYGALLGRGNVAGDLHAVGVAYSPAADRWRRLPDHPLSPQASSVAWTGDELVAWDYLLDAAAYDPASDAWTSLPRLPLQPQECHPASALVGGEVFAWYCGQAAVLDPATRSWEAVDVPAGVHAGGVWSTDPVGAGGAVLFADHRGLWRYTR